MKKILISLSVIILAGLGLYALYAIPKTADDASLENGLSYTNSEYEVSFIYPEGYILSETESTNEGELRFTATVVAEGDDVLPEAGEGPVSVTVSVYRNTGNISNLQEWLTKTDASNFKLSDGTYETVLVDSEPAIAYRWSGLYEADTTAVFHKDSVVVISGTYIAPEDDIREAYRTIVDSFDLQ